MTFNDKYPWPMLLTFMLGVIVPTACVIWFMNEAVKNERLAVKQKVSAIYKSQLRSIKQGTLLQWSNRVEVLRDRAVKIGLRQELQPSKDILGQSLFYQAVIEGDASAVIIYQQGKPKYPRFSHSPQPGEKPELMKKAQKHEFQDNELEQALALYQQLQKHSAEPAIQAQAVLAQSRCLSKLDRPIEATQKLNDYFVDNNFQGAAFDNGRSIRASALFRLLQLLKDTTGSETETKNNPKNTFDRTAKALETLLLDYTQLAMPASQRRFLMGKLQQWRPSDDLALLYKAESLAVKALEARQGTSKHSSGLLSEAKGGGWWWMGSEGDNLIALYDEDYIQRVHAAFIDSLDLPGDIHVSLSLSNIAGQKEAVLSQLPLDELAQGWTIQLLSSSPSPFADAAKRQIDLYLWTGLLIVLAIVILMALITFYVGQQVRSSRLKNNLIATVSHELKTPLASMRLLVDTLLNGEQKYDKTTQEYLELVAKENTRLTQLIDNFLTFSRMERNQTPFDFSHQSANSIAAYAHDAVRDKFKEAGFHLSFSPLVEDRSLWADRDMLATALINLLENACKYSGSSKEVHLRLESDEGKISFSVQDKGIGIARQHLKLIFNRFYRIEQGVSRETDGCGLGLSIVNFIVTAHAGTISVDSKLSEGSCFSIHLPGQPLKNSG